MKKKFTPPHSKEKIEEARLKHTKLEEAREAAWREYGRMLQENREAKHAEEVRKARVMTHEMKRVLTHMAKDKQWIGYNEVEAKLWGRLFLARYVNWDNEITAAGRAALKAASKTSK